eukprot:TRINITY_DN16759_c0_g1_i1.p1 TRINITY_DN16759_c0_g1~~TRINITY_DN16759_c0_g1_i1.p1  ORF type:complete len:333 (+),score=101.29 TRINITY_DN16759_c0_g1_i1:82-1080(+)
MGKKDKASPKGAKGGGDCGDTWPLTRHSLQEIADGFAKGKQVSTALAAKILETATGIVSGQATVVDVAIPKKETITVVGDTHGQVGDVLEIFRKYGLPTRDRMYVFNGDYVDRGPQGCEVVLLLCGWLICDPTSLYMMRGNHEDRTVTGMYGFAEEARKKYGAAIYDAFVKLFAALPLGAVLQEQVLVLHGGLFRDPQDASALAPLASLRAVTSADRRQHESCPPTGLMADILWSDPTPASHTTALGPNEIRGSGCHFDDDTAAAWLDQEGLSMLVRSHEGPDLQDLSDGYSERADGRVVTVFSARNYCGMHGNQGAVVTFGRDMFPKYQSF